MAVTTASGQQPPYDLVVDDAVNGDNSYVHISTQTLASLDLKPGDTVMLKGKKHRKTVCFAFDNDTCPNWHIQMNSVVQNNLGVRLGGTVIVEACLDFQLGKRIEVLPIRDTTQRINSTLSTHYLNKYFNGNRRPIFKGDVFAVDANIRNIEFIVIDSEPSPYCTVVSNTKIHCGNAITREELDALLNDIDYNDIGGLESAKHELKNLAKHRIKCSERFFKFSIPPSRGVLLYGPSGCGKTLLAKAIANEFKVKFIALKCTTLLYMKFKQCEAYIRDLFNKARQEASCVLFFKELDSIAKAPGDGTAHHIINQILTEMDNMGEKKNIFIIGAANRPDIIDSAILRPGRLDQLINIPLPDDKSRMAILRSALEKSSVAQDVILTDLVNNTKNYSGADLIEICQRAYKLATTELIQKEIDREEARQLNRCSPMDDDESVPVPEIRRVHFEEAMKFARSGRV